MRSVISYFAWLLGAALAACGGTTDSSGDDPSGSSNRNGQAGSAPSGSAGQQSGGTSTAGTGGGAGSSAGGSSSEGGSGAGDSGAGSGGSSVFIGGGGTTGMAGAGSLDPRCPSKAPSSTCATDEAGVVCQYEPTSSCLCYTTPVGVFVACTKVDPSCTAATPSGGSSGFSIQNPAPPNYRCTCDATSSNWICGNGI